MDDKRADRFEILDLRPATYRGRKGGAEADSPAHEGQPQPVPVLDLRDIDGASEPPAASPRWHRWTIMAAVFVAGVAAGGYGWYAGTEVTGASRVELIALELDGEVGDRIEQSRFYARVHNAGRRNVIVLDLRFPESPDPIQRPQQELAIPAGESVSLQVSGVPSCEAGVPRSLEAEVHTDVGVASLLIPLPATYQAGSLIAMVCGTSDQLAPGDPGIYFIWDGQNLAAETSPSHMLLDMESVLGNLEILDVSVTAPGFVAEVSNVPLSIRQGAPGHLELVWTVSDCADTYDLGPVDVELILAGRAPVTTQLPPWSIAQLARLAAAECGP